MVGNLESILDWIEACIGAPYTPIEIGGEYFVDYGYICACVCLCIGVYFVFRGLLTFLKGVLQVV